MTDLAYWQRAFTGLVEAARCCPNMTESDREALIAFVTGEVEAIYFAPAPEPKPTTGNDDAGSAWTELGYRRAG